MSMEGIKCADCGKRPADKYSSGTPECWRCWYRRKLDLPAARYWAERVPHLTEQFDMWDWMHFLPACGLSKDEIVQLMDMLAKIREYSQAMVDAGFGDMPNEEELSKTRDKEGEQE